LIASGITVRTQLIPSNWAWRIPALLQAVPSLVQMVFIFFLPESPRYLISKDRREEAFDILIKYHAEGDRNSIFVAAEMAQIETTIKLEMEVSKQSWMDMIRTRGMQRRTFIAAAIGLFTQWSGNTLISFYLSKILGMIGYTDSWTTTRINLGYTVWGLINGTTLAFAAPRFKRRTMFLACAISMAFVYIGWTVAMKYAMDGYNTHRPNNAAGITVIVLFYLYSPCYNIGNNALAYTYLVELFPYAQRSRGIAIEQFFVRCAGFFTTYTNSIGMTNAGWKYLIMYDVIICLEITTIYFFYPETQGRTLEELAWLFEDKALEEKAVVAVEKTIHFDTGNDHIGKPGTEVEHVEMETKPAV